MHILEFANTCKYDRTAELMFEKYQAPALFLAKNAVCSLFHFVTPTKVILVH